MSCQTHSGQQLQAQAGNLLLTDDFQDKLHMTLETITFGILEPGLGNASKSIPMLQNRSPADFLGAISAEGLGMLQNRSPAAFWERFRPRISECFTSDAQRRPGSHFGRGLGNCSFHDFKLQGHQNWVNKKFLNNF